MLLDLTCLEKYEQYFVNESNFWVYLVAIRLRGLGSINVLLARSTRFDTDRTD